MRTWGAYLLRKLGALVLVLIAASMMVYGLLYLAPGGPLAFVLGARTGTPAQIAAIKHEYHLDDPFLTRYFSWVGQLLHGNLGQSLVYRQNVSDLIDSRAPTTIYLVLYSAVLIAIFGITFGTISGIRRGYLDSFIQSVSTVFLSAPVFVVGVILIMVFGVTLGWFPVFGVGSSPLDWVWHLTLPAIALSLSSGAYLSRITRSSVRGELGREHVETARSRGLREATVIRSHVLRNAMIPITTVLGLTIAALIAGSVVVENVFGLEGIGSLLVNAILQRDFAVVQACVLILVVAFVVVNAIVDILYTLIDPRMQLGQGH